MRSNIKGFPNYHWDGENVWDISKNYVIKQSARSSGSFKYVKMKSSEGRRTTVSIRTVEFLAGRFDIPDEFEIVPFTEGKVYINKEGVVYSTRTVAYGVKLQIYSNPCKDNTYPSVTIKYKGSCRPIGVHQLMCVTFYDEKYIDKGLCCLHKDNDKSNYKLSNLKIGTYSENNQQAYDDGINQGRR